MTKAGILATLFLVSGFGLCQSPAIAANRCSEIRGAPDGKLLLFGEMHGSIEAPALVVQLACFLSRSQRVAVGLELPSKDQSLIDAYLVGNGTNSDRQKLISSEFWQFGRDGRSSTAMLKLIENIRVLKKSGRLIDVFAFDDQPGTKLERNVAIASGIRRFHTNHPTTRIIALMGNIHAMEDPIHIGGSEIVPSGSLLDDLHPTSILIAYPAGTIWACMPTCGPQPLRAVGGDTGALGFREGSPMGGYTYTYYLRSITASPPAVQKAHSG
jgi:hypothetical protein